MQTNNKILDDIAKVASGAVGAAFSARDEMQARLRAELERVLERFDLVTRDEFEAVRAMAAKARDEQEKAASTIAALEARLAAMEGSAAKASTPRRAAKPAKSAKSAKEGPAEAMTGKTATKSAATKIGSAGGAKRPRAAAKKTGSSGREAKSDPKT